MNFTIVQGNINVRVSSKKSKGKDEQKHERGKWEKFLSQYYTFSPRKNKRIYGIFNQLLFK